MTEVRFNSQEVADLAKENDLRCIYKSESVFMKVLAVLLFFNKHFLTYVTTVFSFFGRRYMYVPKYWDDYPAATQEIIIRHELVHFRQQKVFKLAFKPFYLLFPLPIGWTFRYYFERQAYLVNYLAKPNAMERSYELKRIVDLLTGPSYFWAGSIWPGKRRTREWFQKRVA